MSKILHLLQEPEFGEFEDSWRRCAHRLWFPSAIRGGDKVSELPTLCQQTAGIT